MNRVLALPRLPFLSALALAFAAAASSGACGGDDVAPAGPGPVPIDAFSAEYQGASCDYAVRCGLMPDRAACLTLDRIDEPMLQLISNAVFGDVSYNPTQARACVEAIRARSCDELLSVARQVEGACRGVFTGSVAAGGPCLVAGECAGESICDRTACEGTGDACCLGVCAPTPAAVPVGGDCTEAPCVDEAYCDYSEGQGGMGGGSGGPTGTCVLRVENGQDCTDSNGCKDGQRCGEGKCYILSTEGGQCNPSLDDACRSINNFCDAGGKCAKLPKPGEPCTPGGRCAGYAFCDGTTCRMRPLEGEACTADGPRCLGDLRCETDVCVAPGTPRVCVAPTE